MESLRGVDSVLDVFREGSVDERSMGVAVARLQRIAEIQKLLIDQLRILETMTPLDFLDFRDLLVPASGFQSVQFRMIEKKLGLRGPEGAAGEGAPGSSPSPARGQVRPESDTGPSLFALVEKWLERTPFLELPGYEFWASYRAPGDAMLAAGGSSRHPCLRATVERNKIFADFYNLSPFLISRPALPALPPDLERRVGFYYPRD